MAEEEKKVVVKVIVLPYHGQGHMNPMLQFCKRLASKGVLVTLATTLSTAQNITQSHSCNNLQSSLIAVESIYDDTDEGRLGLLGPGKFKARMERYEAHAAHNLGPLITNLKVNTNNGQQQDGVKCLVYDADLPWAARVGKQHGLLVAAFSTQACSYIASFYPLYLQAEENTTALAALGELPPLLPPPSLMQQGLPCIPSLGTTANASTDDDGGGKQLLLHPVIRMVLKQFTTLGDADWLLFNSFDHLEHQVVKWMSNLWPVKTIGPTLPSAYLDKRVEYDVDYGFNLYKSNNPAVIDWLNNKKKDDSVVYVSFGSAASLSVEQIGEIAEALKQIPSSFLWVVRETEASKLPTNFISETSAEKGLVVSWCPQLDVLAHRAVACFVTHCGWNSTMEALSLGVPMLAMPQFLDQFLDAHFVDQVWGVGIRPKADEKGLVSREEIRDCLGELMRGERAEKIKEKAAMWKAYAKEAVDQGGSSDKHIDEIIARLASA